MKLTAILLSMLCLAPAAALAQQGPPPMPMSGDMHGGMPGMMRGGDMKQMMQAHEAFRHQLLAAITPAHKQLLASVVGQLAIADKPDPKAAAAKLDAALSGGEKQSILAAHSAMMAQMKTMMKAQHDQMMQAWQSAHPDATPWPKRSPRAENSPRTPDPGMILLMVAGHGGEMMMMGGHHEHPTP